MQGRILCYFVESHNTLKIRTGSRSRSTFLIVVAGILIAFQITEWNEVRKNDRIERALIERLTIEFETLGKTLDQRFERSERLLSHTSELIAAIRGNAQPEDSVHVKTMLKDAARYSAAVPMPTSFSDALQSGQIGSLRNETLRDSLNAYNIARDWWATVEGPRPSQTDPNSKLNQAITWSAEPSLTMTLDRSVLSYDWNLLREAEKELVAIHRHQTLQAEAYRLELVEVAKVIAATNAYQEGR